MATDNRAVQLAMSRSVKKILSQKYARWSGTLFLGVLLFLYLAKRLGAARILELAGLLALCLVVALFGLATGIGFYSETRLLLRAYRREASPIRMFLQVTLLGVALIVLLLMVVGAIVASIALLPEIYWEAMRAT